MDKLARTIGRVAGMLLVLALMLATVTCGGGKSEPDYASQMTESILLALKTDDYTRFAADFSPEMKKGMDEPGFHRLTAILKPQIGTYVSKEYWKVESENQFINVYYKAKFTQEPEEVIVRAVFQNIAGKMYVAGFWLDSPKLRQQ